MHTCYGTTHDKAHAAAGLSSTTSRSIPCIDIIARSVYPRSQSVHTNQVLSPAVLAVKMGSNQFCSQCIVSLVLLLVVYSARGVDSSACSAVSIGLDGSKVKRDCTIADGPKGATSEGTIFKEMDLRLMETICGVECWCYFVEYWMGFGCCIRAIRECTQSIQVVSRFKIQLEWMGRRSLQKRWVCGFLWERGMHILSFAFQNESLRSYWYVLGAVLPSCRNFYAPSFQGGCEIDGNPECTWRTSEENIFVVFGNAGQHTLTSPDNGATLTGSRDSDGDPVNAQRMWCILGKHWHWFDMPAWTQLPLCSNIQRQLFILCMRGCGGIPNYKCTNVGTCI